MHSKSSSPLLRVSCLLSHGLFPSHSHSVEILTKAVVFQKFLDLIDEDDLALKHTVTLWTSSDVMPLL